MVLVLHWSVVLALTNKKEQTSRQSYFIHTFLSLHQSNARFSSRSLTAAANLFQHCLAVLKKITSRTRRKNGQWHVLTLFVTSLITTQRRIQSREQIANKRQRYRKHVSTEVFVSQTAFDPARMPADRAQVSPVIQITL